MTTSATHLLLDSSLVDAWRLLDQPEHQSEFTQIKETPGGTQVTAAFIIDGMHCAACTRAIEAALSTLPGLIHSEVSYAGQRARVTYRPEFVLPSRIALAIHSAGYKALPVRSIHAENVRKAEHRLALWRLLVAGFCMMQIMMYTTPLYLAAPGEIEGDIEQLLRWASWVLCLPVLFFSAGPFFKSAWADLRAARLGMDTPVALGIALAFAAGTVATVQPNGPLAGESYLDAISMLVFFLLAGRFLEQKARNKTIGLIDGIVQRIPEWVDRVDPQTQTITSIAATQLRVGDLVRVRAGQAFDGDGVVEEGTVYANEALLTGESRPVRRAAGEAVLAGAINLQGPALIRITALAKSTRFAQIGQLVEQVAAQKPRLAQLADRIAAPFLLIVVALAIVAAAAWWWLEPALAPHMPLKVALAVLIVTCPCALALATPSAMLAAAGHLANRGLLVRRVQALESLAQANTFVFDKTGTLTEDRLALDDVVLYDSLNRNTALGIAAALAESSLHPIARALVFAARKECIQVKQDVAQIQEHAGSGVSAIDARQRVLKLGSAVFCGADQTAKALNDGPRCYLSIDGRVVACFTFAERLRDGAGAGVEALRARGVRTGILSGDGEQATERLAAAIHADFARGSASPESKLELLRAMQRRGETVAVIGDGVNDAPILAQANVSFSLGEATPLAQQTADFIVLSNRISDVAYAHAFARKTMGIVRQNLWWAAAYNLICVPLAVAGKLPPWLAALGMAASSLLVVANALRLVRSADDAGGSTAELT
jgi:Cu2+-exporting ATPase